MQQLVFLMEVAGFHIEDHLVDAAGVDDLDLPTLDILEAGHDLFHLMGVDEHALDAGGVSTRPTMLPRRGLVRPQAQGARSM